MPREKYSSRISYTLIGNLFRAIISFVTSMFIARELAPENYGRYVFLIGTFIALKQIVDFSSSSAFFTFISQKKRSLKFIKIYWVYVALQLLLPLFIIALVIPSDLIKTIWQDESKTLIILALFAVFFQSTVWPITVQMAESIRKTYYVQIINVSLVFLHFLVIISLWYFKLLAIPLLFIVITIEWLIASLLLLNIFKINNLKIINENNDDDSFKNIFNEFWIYCSPFIPLMIFGFINDFGEKWMLQTWGGSEHQAYFGIANQYAAIVLLATVSIIKPFWKEIAEANKKKDFKLVKKLYQNSTRLLFFVSLIVSLPLLPYADDILFISLGDSYAEGSMTFTIMLLYPIHQSIGQINGTMFYATEKTRPYVIGNIIFMIFSILFTIIVLAPKNFLIPGLSLGSEGVALKLVLLQLIQVNIFSWYLSKIFKWNFDGFNQMILFVFSLFFLYSSHLAIKQLSINNTYIEFSFTTILFLFLMLLLVLFKPDKVGLSKGFINKYIFHRKKTN
ncbi:MAG: hypothetical protein P8I26_01975 [Flavobacteriaceae bacterium]|nr:hypothetical protein [Flavobacteriaceae bacterium]